MDPRTLPLRDLRRLVSDLWGDSRCNHIAGAVLDAAVSSDAKSCDRAMLVAYLRHFPSSHPAFDGLRAAASFSANKRDWPWRVRWAEWKLSDPEAGPATVAAALLTRADPAAVLREAGLDGDMAQSAFVVEAVRSACEQAAAAHGDGAVEMGLRLIALLETLTIGGLNGALARALLLPWIDGAPPKTYRDRITKLLTARIGDPRFETAKWDALLAEFGPNAGDLINLLRRWLTDTTVREFFKVVGVTTNDPAQWAEREAFWLGYLDAGAIETAWFALGSRAEDKIRTRSSKSRVDYGRIIGERQYADPSHSSLVLSIGDLRIAEWSHSGACRFWRSSDRTAPQQYRPQYFGYQLRAMNGGKDFESISHFSSWQWRYAHKIAEMTGVRHPLYGSGHG